MKKLLILLSMFSFASQAQVKKEALHQPLVTNQYTADPSAHVFNNSIYIYPSHDIEAGVKPDDLGSHFAMRDYHVFSQKSPADPITDHGVALKLEDIPWASKMLWAPDAAEKDGTYYFYFPAKDKDGIFRIGVATANRPEGPFVAEKNYMEGVYSIDPTVFKDKDGSYYLYVGGIMGGQLQHWKTGTHLFDESQPAADQPALMPKMAKLSADMKHIESPLKDVQILDKQGQLLLSSDHKRRFFEGAFMHKYKGKYYLSYSTGDTHFIAYAIGDSPKGPFTYEGVLLNPVEGWTTQHSIIEQQGKWYLYFHDALLSGKTHLRNIKVTELKYHADGTIQTISAYK